MTVTLDLNAETEQALLLQARERGISLDVYLQNLLNEQARLSNAASLAEKTETRPLKTGRGLLAKYGPAPSAEEIHQNRHDMFSSFAQDF